MRKGLIMCIFILTFCASVGIASAGVPDIHANDVFRREPGERFEIEVFVVCHADEANYTVNVTLHPRFQFVEEESDMIVSGSNASITYLGYDTDELRFEFPMMAFNDTPDGDYNIPYRVYWNGSETSFVFTLVESDTVQVSVGEGGDSPCSTTDSLILPIFGICIAFGIFKKGKR